MSMEGTGAGGAGSGTGDTGTGGNVGDQGSSFIETLPEDLRGNEAFKGIDSTEKLARAHIDALGKMAVAPETADGYEITLPEGTQVNEAFLTGFKSWAHEAGLSTAQAAKLAEKYLAFEGEQRAAFEREQEKQVAAVKVQWGAKFDENVQIARKAVAEFCTPEDRKFLDESGMGDNPVLIRMFHRIGLAMSEDKVTGGGGSGGAPRAMPRTAGGTPQLHFPSMEKRE